MNRTGRMGLIAAVASLALASATVAQTAQNQQSQQNQQNQSQSQDQMTGVSQPPPDSTIQATENLSPPDATPTPAPSRAKPSAAIPATPANSSANPPAAAAQAPAEDPDAGIVTSVPPANAAGQAADPDYGIVTTAPPATARTLRPSGFDPDSDIVNYVPVDPNALGEGTNITVSLQQDLSTTETEPGALFRAVVTQDVYNGARVVIPAGAVMQGRVTHVSQGHHIGPHATLRLRPEEIILPDGTAYHLYAEAVASMAPGTRVNDEGGIEASHHFVKDAFQYGAGAGAGVAAGAAVGGPVGAGVGSVVGAGLVTTHMLIQPPQSADLPKGSVLIFSLTEPMSLTPTKN